MTLREEILNRPKRAPVPIVVPQWGDMTVYVKPLTAKQREEYEQVVSKAQERNRYGTLRARLLTLVLCDEGGELQFSAEGDIDLLAEQDAAAIEVIFDVVRDENALGADTDEDTKKA